MGCAPCLLTYRYIQKLPLKAKVFFLGDVVRSLVGESQSHTDLSALFCLVAAHTEENKVSENRSTPRMGALWVGIGGSRKDAVLVLPVEPMPVGSKCGFGAVVSMFTQDVVAILSP